MAGAAVIGALRVVIGADTAVLEKGLKDASSKLSDFGSSIARAGAIAAAGLAAVAAGLGAAVMKTANEADKLGKASQSIGIPIEELSKLKYAAELSGVTFEELTKSVGKFSKTMGAAAIDGSGEAAKAFGQIGVSVKNADGSMRDTTAVLVDVADKFSGVRDGAAKTALAMMLFGKSGASMIPLLNEGRDGIRGLMTEAEQLGIVLDGTTYKAAEAFNDNLERLGKVKDALTLKITAQLVPALERFTQIAVDAAKNSDTLRAVGDGLARAMDGIVRAIILVYDNLGLLWKLFQIFITTQIAVVVVNVGLAFVSLAIAIREAGLVLAAFEVIRGISMRGFLLIAGVLTLVTGQFDAFKQAMASMWDKVSAMLPNGLTEGISSALKAMGVDLRALEMDLKNFKASPKQAADSLDNLKLKTDGAKNAVDAFLSAQEKRKAALEAEAQTVGLATRAQERLRIQLQAETIAKENNITITDALRAKINQTADSYGNVALSVEKSKEAFQSFQDIQQFAGQQFISIFSDMISGANNFADSMKRVSKAILDALLQAMILGSGPLSGLFGGLQSAPGKTGGLIGLLTGMMNFPGFATGGSFEVGGTGGIDSQLAAFKVTPGERVTVSKDGQKIGGGQFTYSPIIDARGADAGAVARLAEVMARDQRNFERNVMNVFMRSKTNIPGFA